MVVRDSYGKNIVVPDFVLSCLKVSDHYGANRSETKIPVRHLLF